MRTTIMTVQIEAVARPGASETRIREEVMTVLRRLEGTEFAAFLASTWTSRDDQLVSVRVKFTDVSQP